MQLFSAGLFATTTVVSAKGLANDLSNYSSVKYDIQTSQCFVEGTLVLTKEGNKPIEEIQAGDLVYATDPETGGSGYKEVLRTFRKESDVLIHVFVNGEEIETTAVHPFWVENRWVSAKDLKEGDLLTLADGSAARISGVYGEKLDEAVVVYNFEVEEFHTYYVTEAGVLVHNANKVGGCGVTGNKSDSNTVKNGATRAAKYSSEWGYASLQETINKFAPNVEPVVTSKGKIIYNNLETGISVVYDNNGNYFRIEDTTRPRGRNYLDINGNDMNNEIVNGKTRGRSKPDYQRVTHFNNSDK